MLPMATDINIKIMPVLGLMLISVVTSNMTHPKLLRERSTAIPMQNWTEMHYCITD